MTPIADSAPGRLPSQSNVIFLPGGPRADQLRPLFLQQIRLRRCSRLSKTYFFFIKRCSRLSWRHLFARPGRPDGAPVSVKRNDCCRLGSNIAMAESAMPSKSTGNVAQLAEQRTHWQRCSACRAENPECRKRYAAQVHWQRCSACREENSECRKQHEGS